MSRRLSDIETAYEQLNRDMEPCYNRDVRLGQLMTELERDHGVPVLGSLAKDMGDTPALDLYREISNSRTFVLGMA